MSTNTFADKRVLFIAPKFYKYHSSIKRELEKLNANVVFFPEIEHSVSYRLYSKISPRLKKWAESKYMNYIADNIQLHEFDIVFVIRGCACKPNVIFEMRNKLPKALFIMYQWDSIKQNNYLELIRCFDVVKTFDSEDAKKYNLDYYALFFTEEYGCIPEDSTGKKYALSFFGAYHSDRLEIIKYFEGVFKNTNYQFKHHLYIKKIALFRRLLTGVIKVKDLKYFKTYPVQSSEIIRTYEQSVAVLDIELSIQSGLSMRTFEVLGAGLKLVTTNYRIQDEPFYKAECIHIIDRKKLKMSLDFFNENSINNVVHVEKHNLRNWLENLML